MTGSEAEMGPLQNERIENPTRYKLEIRAEYEQCDKQGKGALPRRENLYPSLISEWRKQGNRGSALGGEPHLVV